MTLYYEVYDPAKWAEKKDSIHLLTSIEFFRGKVKVYETPVVEVQQLNAADRQSRGVSIRSADESTDSGLVHLPGERNRRRRCGVRVSENPGASETVARFRGLR